MPQIAQARSADDLECVRTLFREYAQGVAAPCCFADFERELAGLPGEYAPPAGGLFLARDGAGAAGCVALRALDSRSAEMKRLYVRAQHRGAGLGRALAAAALATAREARYARMVLDTLPKMTEAIMLYRSLGFRPTGPYSPAPTPGAIFFELELV
jgi:ribosomal protein S18 acetylase RimI-like enzyme